MIKNPKATLAGLKGLNFKFPKNSSVVVEDQTDLSAIYLNIPRKPDFKSMELTDKQLEVVAGGEIGLAVGISLLTAVIIAEYY